MRAEIEVAIFKGEVSASLCVSLTVSSILRE